MTREIILTKGFVAIVDDDDYERLNQWKWHCHNQGYAARNTDWSCKGGKESHKTILMHRIILNPDVGIHVDHINHNTLDNRKCNLRLATRSQNNWNQSKTRGTSKYKGVVWDKERKKWVGQISKNKKKHFKRFDDEIEAAKFYNEKAKELFGEFAKLNII